MFLQVLLTTLLLPSALGQGTSPTYALNVGLVDPSGNVDSPNVMANGSPKAESQWDPVPFSQLSTWNNPKVTFALWINDLPGAMEEYPVNIDATFVSPEGEKTNYANCLSPPKLSTSTGTLKKLNDQSFNASALRVTFDPQQNCTQAGQSQVYFTISTPDSQNKTVYLAKLWFFTTHGNPLNIGTTVGGNDVVNNNGVQDKWDPKHLSDGNKGKLYSVGSLIKSIVFYLHIPSDRRQDGPNPLVLGDANGVTLEGSPNTRQTTSCTAGKNIPKACQANVRPIPPPKPTSGGIWEEQRTIDAGLDFSLHIDYVCETNGYVDLVVEIPLQSGFAPVTFAWRKACQRTPGLAIATNPDAVFGDPDVAQDGLIRPEWDSRNTSIVDGDAGKVLTERKFYFWVNPAGVNVKPADFASTNYTSSPHPKKGETNLKCKPSPKWEIATNFDSNEQRCSGTCTWKAIPSSGIKNNAPSSPLAPNTAPLRAIFDYSDCSGQGAVLLSFEMTFGEFDLIRVGWYKFLGTPPGLTIGCQSGCPNVDTPNGTKPVTSIVVNGAVQSDWLTKYGPLLDNRILQASWSISADKTISDYDFSISNIVAKPDSTTCQVAFSGELGSHFVKGSWSGVKKIMPGDLVSLGMVFICQPQQDFINIGTSDLDPTEQENVNSEGSPGKAWKTPSEGCIEPDPDDRKQDCTLDERGREERKFYITYKDQQDAPGSAVIPAPTSALDPSKQYPGLHQSYFFTYNSSDMVGCSPFWDISQEGIITDKFDFIKQGKATITGKSPPIVLTINYNCSTGFIRCGKPGSCSSLFTGFVPINSIGCDSAHPTDVKPCSYPMFRWIKTVAPIQPDRGGLDLSWEPFPFGGNVTWSVPDSGDGADLHANQRIKKYNITIQNMDTKEKKAFILNVNGTEYQKPMDSTLSFEIKNMTGDEYQLWMNVTNEAGLSSQSNIFVQPGTPVKPNNPLAPMSIAVIAAISGACLVVFACLMYHCCIKSQKQVEDPLLSSGVQTVAQPNQPRSTLLASEDPYENYQPPMQMQDDKDADAMLQGLLNEK